MYGVVLNPDASPQRYIMRQHFINYFGDPVLRKTQIVKNKSYFIAEPLFQTMGETRYLIVSVINDRSPLNTDKTLSDITWQTLQTRKFNGDEKKYNVPTFTYQHKDNFLNVKDEIMLKLIDRKDSESTYISNTGLLLNLLIKEGNSKFYYPNALTLTKAIEEYNTLIGFSDI